VWLLAGLPTATIGTSDGVLMCRSNLRALDMFRPDGGLLDAGDVEVDLAASGAFAVSSVGEALASCSASTFGTNLPPPSVTLRGFGMFAGRGALFRGNL